MSTEAKYACIVLSMSFPFPRVEKPFPFDSCTELKPGSLKDQVDTANSKHWGEWIGSLRWERLCEDKLILITCAPTKTADILDGENKDLENKVFSIFRLLPLVGPVRPSFDEVFLLTGTGIHSGGEYQIRDVRQFSQVTSWRNSYYAEERWEEYQDWAQTHFSSSTILTLWKDAWQHYDRLFVKGNLNQQLVEGIRSFLEAMWSSQLEFKIPNLVRSIECVVDCWGKTQFADKVLYLVGTPCGDLPFSISHDTRTLLEDLYQLRNDCSHGKKFAYTLEKKFGKPPDKSLVAKFEFLAEWAARMILNDSFINQTILSHTSDRDSLVSAWQNKKIKPLPSRVGTQKPG